LNSLPQACDFSLCSGTLLEGAFGCTKKSIDDHRTLALAGLGLAHHRPAASQHPSQVSGCSWNVLSCPQSFFCHAHYTLFPGLWRQDPSRCPARVCVSIRLIRIDTDRPTRWITRILFHSPFEKSKTLLLNALRSLCLGCSVNLTMYDPERVAKSPQATSRQLLAGNQENVRAQAVVVNVDAMLCLREKEESDLLDLIF
jgi:hypothetical protein